MAMTLFNSFYVVVVTIVISFSLFLRTSLCSEIPQPPSYAPRPLSPYQKYLSNCASKLKPAECGKQIFEAVFVGNETVSDNCCHSLVVDVGKTCHLDMTRYIAESPLFAKNKKEILSRGDKVWKYCTLIIRPNLP
jgi:hypothetical protein